MNQDAIEIINPSCQDQTRAVKAEKMTKINIDITSEIGSLKSVLLRRPGEELNNLTPETLDELLFDDIPFLENAQKEHDAFANMLGDLGVNVLYLEDLVGDVLKNKEVAIAFIHEFLSVSNITTPKLIDALSEHLSDYSGKALAQKLMSGLKKNELDYQDVSLNGQVNKADFFWLNPVPNLYFTRDPASSVGNMVLLNSMFAETRKRESLFIESIFKHHPDFKHNKVLNSSAFDASIEGGDILVLDKHTLAIGISQRTSAHAIEKFALELFFNDKLKAHHQINKILAFHIPSSRAFMHLDTVLTQVDLHKMTMHQGIVGKTQIYRLTPGTHRNVESRLLAGSIENTLANELDKDIQIIYCGGRDSINGSREQWSDGANTLAVKPGEVFVYQRNRMTNQILENRGVSVHKMPCSELSRGRGGPRCMSMPLERSKL